MGIPPTIRQSKKGRGEVRLVLTPEGQLSGDLDKMHWLIFGLNLRT